MKSVLVTGAAGFIGSRLAASLQSHGMQVFTLATARGGLDAAALLNACYGTVPDAVIHAAGSGTVSQVAAAPAQELPANLAALLTVLEFARTAAPQMRVVLLSSAARYGNAPPTPQREADVREPVSLYGLAKAQTEQLVAFYAQRHGVTATAVRLFSVYGPGLRKQLLWDAMGKFGRADAGTPAEFFGTGQELRDWVHVDDVGSFMTRLLAVAPAAPFDVFNCAGGHGVSTVELLQHLAQHAGAAAPRFNGQTRAGDPACLVADCSKAHHTLDWLPQVGWREGVAQYARWYLQEQRS
jgi:UDP-glucose 4-epimerase